MRVGRLSARTNRKQFARKASRVKGNNLFNPRKLHKGGECIR